jgi:hypothetical protein
MKAVFHSVLLTWLLVGWTHGLYLDSAITAFRVADGLITVDGKPDMVWKEIGGAFSQSTSQIRFNDYGKIVLVSDSLRNRPPESLYVAPEAGSATMLAAYDQTYLYFFFIVRENSAFNPAAGGCGPSDLWKANAVEVFVDPAPWSETLYTAYFSADAGQASYGTSPKSFEAAMPAWPGGTGRFYRDRSDSNTFKLRSLPATQFRMASAARLSSDSLTLGVEIRIPVSAADFFPGKSFFVSWGYNHYPGSGGCDELPIAYRWARHIKSYEGANTKPPGWKPGDSVHYDPLASYDGWGRMNLSSNSPLQGLGCSQSLADSAWDLAAWRSACHNIPTSIRAPGDPSRSLSPTSGSMDIPFLRDVRGRRVGRESLLHAVPAAPPKPGRP